MKRCLLLVGVILMVACGSKTPTGPSATTVAGTWTGALSDNTIGPGSLRFTLNQSGSTVTGTWQSTWVNPANNNSGSLTGSSSGTGFSATMTPSVPTSCPFTATATLNSAKTQMTGTYAAFNCSVVSSGSFTVTKS